MPESLHLQGKIDKGLVGKLEGSVVAKYMLAQIFWTTGDEEKALNLLSDAVESVPIEDYDLFVDMFIQGRLRVV